MKDSLGHILATGLRTAWVTLALTGILYPLLVTLAAQTLFAPQARGSLVRDAQGAVVGSAVIGQAFVGPGYLQPRPSAADYDANASGGANLGPTSSRRLANAQARALKLAADNPGAGKAPLELVTASASGLDPHISPMAARWQAPRIAQARGVAVARVLGVIEGQVEGRDWGIFGEARVNVLLMNVALDRPFTRQPSPR